MEKPSANVPGPGARAIGVARGSIIPGGALLAICLFLPAVRSCGNSVEYPYRFPFFDEPYLFGLLAVACAVLIGSGGRAERVFGWLHVAVATASALALGCFYHNWVWHDWPDKRAVASVGSWWAMMALLVPALPPRRRFSFRVARATWTGAAMCVLWFVNWIISEKPLYGIWLSVAASAMLFAGGLLWERAGREQPGG